MDDAYCAGSIHVWCMFSGKNPISTLGHCCFDVVSLGKACISFILLEYKIVAIEMVIRMISFSIK